MRRPIVIQIAAGGFLGLSSLVAGCGSREEGSGELLAGPGSSSTATAGVSSGASPFGGNAAEEGPDVELVAPERATFTTRPQVRVEGVVTDLGEGVAEVHVAGRTVEVDAETGAFGREVDLEPGLNTVLVEAWDDAGRRRERHVSVISGSFAPEGRSLSDAGSVRLTEPVLDLLEPDVAQGIQDQKATIRRQVLAQNVEDVELKSFDFGGVDVAMDAVSGGLRFVTTIQDVVLHMEASSDFLIFFERTVEGDVRARSMRLESTAQVAVQNGQPVVNVTSSSASASGLTLPDWASGERRRIQQTFEQGFADSGARNLQDTLEQTLGSTQTSGQLSRDVLQESLTVEWALEGMTFDADGATASFAANVTADDATYGDRTSSFAVRTDGAGLVGGGAGGGPDTGFTVHEDVLNRALHAAWRAGTLEFRLDQAAMDQRFPGVPSQMDTSALLASAPELAQVLPPDLPLVLHVEGRLPPVVRARPNAPQLFDLDVGALRVRMDVVHPSKGPVELLTAVYALRAPLNLAHANDRVRLEAAGDPELHVDVEGFALPGSERTLEGITATTGPQLFQSTLSRVEGVELPAVQGLTVQGLRFSAQDDSLIALGRARRAPSTTK